MEVFEFTASETTSIQGMSCMADRNLLQTTQSSFD